MKRILYTLTALAILWSCATVLHRPLVTTIYAQGGQVYFHWTPNPAADAVVNYVVTLDNGAPVIVAPVTDPVCGCVKAPAITINDVANHTYSVKAVGSVFTSAAATFVFTVRVPATPAGLGVSAGS